MILSQKARWRAPEVDLCLLHNHSPLQAHPHTHKHISNAEGGLVTCHLKKQNNEREKERQKWGVREDENKGQQGSPATPELALWAS